MKCPKCKTQMDETIFGTYACPNCQYVKKKYKNAGLLFPFLGGRK